MDRIVENILDEIYHNTKNRSFMTINDLEVNFGINGFILRNHLEDLKNLGFIFEAEEGFQISNKGILYCKSFWI